MLLDEDSFILQVAGVFSRIRSGVSPEVDYDGAYRFNLLCGSGGGSSNEAKKA
jgi:hypothetical protein